MATLVQSAGFYFSAAVRMENMRTFGLLAGSAIPLALVSNVLLASALMVLATRRRSGSQVDRMREL